MLHQDTNVARMSIITVLPKVFVIMLCILATLASEDIKENAIQNVSNPTQESHLDDWIDKGGWFSDVPSNSVAKSRQKRFLTFPTGGTFQLQFIVNVPMPGFSDLGVFKLTNYLIYNLPNGTVTWSRNLEERTSMYSKLENFLSGFGMDGHACTLRTLCEIAESPFQHGIYGEVVNLLLSASASPEETGGYDDYMTAEYYGRHYGDCGAIYNTCETSVLSLISDAF